MDRAKFIAIIELTVGMAADHAIETRIRRLSDAHLVDGITPRTLVMNADTWKRLVWEVSGTGFRDGYFWTPQPEGTVADPKNWISSFLGLPILIKDFMPDLEVIIGV